MAHKSAIERVGKRVDEFCSACEKITLRALLCGCFMVEVVRVLVRLLR